MKIIIIFLAFYILSISQLLSNEPSVFSNEPIGGMYFSYYENDGEIVKLEFNIAEGNMTNIDLYIKYDYRGFKEVTISCDSTYYNKRVNYTRINTNCNKGSIKQFLYGDINLIRLKKRSENGVVANLNILRISHKESFYKQLKKNPSHNIKNHIFFVKEEIKKAEIKIKQDAKIKAERELKASIKRELKASIKREKDIAKANKEARERKESQAKAKEEREAKARIEKAKSEKKAIARAKKEAKAKEERQAKARIEKAKSEKKAQAKAKIVAELNLELAEWNKQNKIKLFLYDIENFVKTYPKKLDNRKLIKLLKPVKDIDNKKLAITSDNLYFVDNLDNFLMSNSDFYDFRKKSIADRENAKILALDNEMKAKKEARERAIKEAKLKLERKAKIEKLRKAKEEEEKEFMLSFVKLKISIFSEFMNNFIDNYPLNDKSYDLLIILEKYNDKVLNYPNDLNEDDIEILTNSIKKLSLYEDYEPYLNKYIKNNADYNNHLERFKLIKKEKEEELLALKNEIIAKQEAIKRTEADTKKRMDQEAAKKAAIVKAKQDAIAKAKQDTIDKEEKAKAERKALDKEAKNAKSRAIATQNADIKANVTLAYGRQQKYMYDLVRKTIQNSRGKSPAAQKRMWIDASKKLCSSSIFNAYGDKKDWVGKLTKVSMDDKGEVSITISILNENTLWVYSVPVYLVDSIVNIDLGPLNWLDYAKNGPLIKFSGNFKKGNMNESECLDAGLTAAPELVDESFSFKLRELKLLF